MFGKCSSLNSIFPYCSIFSGNTCTSCLLGYYLAAGVCSPASSLCYTYDMKNGNCTNCYNGYTLSGPTCISSTATNANATNATTTNTTTTPNATITNTTITPNTTTTSNSSCSIGFYLNNNTGICTQVDPSCNTYNPNTGECLSCYTGSTLSGSICVFLSSIDPNCNTFSGLTCTDCYNGFFIGSSGLCTPANPICQNYSMTTGQCLSCHTGYELNGTTCVQLSTLVPDCSTFTGIICISCINGYYLNNGSCFPGNPLCSTYNMTGGSCLSCFQGYYLSGSNCLVINPLCKTVDVSGSCASCYQGYAVSGTTCIQLSLINPQCSTFNGLICTNCYNGFYIGSNGICTQVNYLCKTYSMFSG